MRLCAGRSGWPAAGAERGGDFLEPRMALNRLSQFLNAEIYCALADAVTVGVIVDAGQRAWLADGEHDVVKLAVIGRNH